jgi:hypothetical protein
VEFAYAATATRHTFLGAQCEPATTAAGSMIEINK